MAILSRIDDDITTYPTGNAYMADNPVDPKTGKPYTDSDLTVIAAGILNHPNATSEQLLRAWGWLYEHGYAKQMIQHATQQKNQLHFGQNVVSVTALHPELVKPAMTASVSPVGKLVNFQAAAIHDNISDGTQDAVETAGGLAIATALFGPLGPVATAFISGTSAGFFNGLLATAAHAFKNPYASPAGDDPDRPGRSLGDTRTWLEELGAIYPSSVRPLMGKDGTWSSSIIWISPAVLKWLNANNILDVRQNIAGTAPGGIFASLETATGGTGFYPHTEPTDIKILDGNGVYHIQLVGLSGTDGPGYAMTVFDDGTIRFDKVTEAGDALPANGASYFHAGAQPNLAAGTLFNGAYGNLYKQAIQAAITAAQNSLGGTAPFTIDPAQGDTPLSINDVLFLYSGASGGMPNITQTTQQASQQAGQQAQQNTQAGGFMGTPYTQAQWLQMIQSGNIPADALKWIQQNPNLARLYTQYTGKNINADVVASNTSIFSNPAVLAALAGGAALLLLK